MMGQNWGRVFFVRNGGPFTATLVAPWVLKKMYFEDPIFIQFFVPDKIDFTPKMLRALLLSQKWRFVDQG